MQTKSKLFKILIILGLSLSATVAFQNCGNISLVTAPSQAVEQPAPIPPVIVPPVPDAVPSEPAAAVTEPAWETSLDQNGLPVVIPNPQSRQPGSLGTPHSGLNGAGDHNNAWAVDPSRCDNTTPKIIHSWHQNIDIEDYGGRNTNEFFEMAPNEALTYRFVFKNEGWGDIGVSETPRAMPSNVYMTISTKACDFDLSKVRVGSQGSPCYKTGTGTASSLAFEVTDKRAPQQAAGITCQLKVGTTYYFNIRFKAARTDGSPLLDFCGDVLRSPLCGGLLYWTFARY